MKDEEITGGATAAVALDVTTTTTGSTTTRRKMGVDMSSHMGLRGVAAVWVMVYHCFRFSTFNTHVLLGPSLMPLFFILSGFTLAVVYGSETWQVMGCRPSCGSASTEKEHNSDDDGDCKPFNWRAFYWNRFARVMPVYYICNLLAIPLVLGGYTDATPDMLGLSLMVTLLPISMVFSCFGPDPSIPQVPILDGPSWFVQCLIWFWLPFPLVLTRAQRYTNRQLVNSMVWCFYAQIIISFTIKFVIEVHYGMDTGFYAAVMSLYRFPVFLMGVYAGVLACRNHDQPLPWPRYLLFFPVCCSSRASEPYSPEKDQLSWARTADALSLILPVLTIGAGYSDVFMINAIGLGWNPNIHFQLVIAFLQLTVTIALTRDGGKSLASRFLRLPPVVWVGKISASLYLVHEVLLRYVVWGTRGRPNAFPDISTCGFPDGTPEKDACVAGIIEFNAHKLLQPWAIPIVIVVSFLAASVLFYGFEEPIRKWMKKDKKNNKDQKQTEEVTPPSMSEVEMGEGSKDEEFKASAEV